MAEFESALVAPRTDSSLLSRRHAIAGLALLPAALPVAAEPNPIFAVIAAKRAADVAHLEACRALTVAERRHGVDSDKADAAFVDGGPACHAAYASAKALASTPPSTLAGVLGGPPLCQPSPG